MSITPLLTELFGMTFSGIKPGLERIQQLCERIGNPQDRLSVIHVAGTNGKGSTSAMIASILQCAGYNVGLYTSPHISRFNERMRINGVMIEDDDVVRLASPLLEHSRAIGGTFFEVTTALAFAWFAERHVDVAVIETGLGGRLDATNIVQPILSVITYIDLDHTDYLGHTVQAIANEKAGIIKEGAPAVIAPQGRQIASDGSLHLVTEIQQAFRTRAKKVGTSVVFADDVIRVDVDSIRPDLSMSVSVISGDKLEYYDVDLAGNHQARNVATVLCAIPQLRHVLFIEPEHIREGLATLRTRTGLNGRIQCVRTQPPAILDVSHNPSGIQALRQTLADAGYPDQSWHVVFGAMSDKDIVGMLSDLRPLVSTLHLCTPNVARATSTDALNQVAQSVGYQRITVHPSVFAAAERALMRGPTLICGSFHVAEEALPALNV